jgi:hypothetical protein
MNRLKPAMNRLRSDAQVALGQLLDAHRADQPEQRAIQPADHRARESSAANAPNLPQESEQNQDHRADLHHVAAGDFGQPDQADVLRVRSSS